MGFTGRPPKGQSTIYQTFPTKRIGFIKPVIRTATHARGALSIPHFINGVRQCRGVRQNRQSKINDVNTFTIQ